MNIYVNAKGRIVSKRERRATMPILLMDHTSVDAFELTRAVIVLWRGYFSEYGLEHTVQSEDEFFGNGAMSSADEELRRAP